MNEASLPEMSLVEAIQQRRSVRGFLDTPVPEQVIDQVLSLAQRAPSNCNTQPWKVYIASGAMRDSLREKLVQRAMSGATSQADFNYSHKFEGVYRRRQVECATEMYGEMGIARDDKEARMRAGLRNLELFDAPHVAFIGMDKKFGTTIALDVGMYAQTLMLSLTAFGIGSCAMGSLRHQPDIVREAFGIDDSIGIVLGLCFGYEDKTVAANNTRVGRETVADTVVFKT
ncbi:MAG: nitroreductase [Halieaceae bacterium]|jgi:nitroreductase|nr:nitroreductase [Halieaceae bacterium]